MSDDESGRITLEIGFPADRSGYLRHECPVCMMEFKIKGDEARFTDALNVWVAKTLERSGVSGAEGEGSSPSSELACPYCAERNTAQSFLHPEWRELVKRIALREIVEPMMHKMLSSFEDSFSGGGRSSVTVRVESRRARSVRPLSGPDPDDMVRVACLACDERFKLVEGWNGAVRCPSCFSELRLG